jgi:hypothetical protein
VNKKIYLSLIINSILSADIINNSEILHNSVKSFDNGGTKSAIDAYKDGIGLSGTTAGAPGSGGINAKYGGGSYGTDLGKGAVRIIYGINRSFPATNVKLTSSLGNVVTY